MKRLLAVFFCLSLPWLPAHAQTAKPPTPSPAAKPASTPTDGRTAGSVRPGQVSVQRFTGHLSAEPAQFILDVQGMMLATNNAGAKTLGDQLRQLWGSNQLTASQQAAIAGLSQKMLDKKMRPIPHLTAFYSAVVGGKNKAKLTDTQVDQYLDAVSQSVEKDANAGLEQYLLATAKLLNGGSLYRSGFNSLRVVGGQLAFAYKAAPVVDPNATFDAPAAPAKPEPLPAPKPASAAKPVAKAAPKPKPAAKKKRASDGWDTADMWSSGSKSASKNDGWSTANDGWGAPAPKKKAVANDGWGSSDDGWGAPAPKKKAPVKTVAKAPAKAAPAKPIAAKPASPTPSTADFDQANQPFVPSPSAAFDAYYPPPATGAVVELKDADIVMSTSGDSLVLHKVSGTVAPTSSRFIATGGQVAWTVKGNPVTADLAGFDFDLGKPEFTAQPVTLTYPFLLEAPVKGALSYKSVRRKPGATESSYPRFISLTNDVRIKDLGPGIKYQGGLSMAGSRILSAALDGSLSHLTVSQEGKTRFRAASRNYVLSDSVITAGRAAVALYASTGDSITHPGVALKYLKKQAQLKLLYEDGMYHTTPYSDSYHQVDIRAQMLVWNLKDPKMDFSIITSPTQVSADFESKNFFSNTRYQQMKSINHLHPLQMLLGYSATHGNANVLNVHDVAEATQTSESNLRTAVSGLARDGYVDIQPQTGEVILLRKARNYVGAAREKRDYDHILLKSLSGSGRSATLNLANNQLLVRGVNQFTFTDDSASVPVIVRPDSGIVRIERNRNLRFGGRVKTSIYGFKGRDFQFDYDGYYIDMPHIDSLTIRSKAKKTAGKTDTEHRPGDFTLSNKGNSQSGRFYLNDPKNRSGRKKLAKYPSFNSTSGAYVYFNKPDVLGGAYDSTTYFDVPPFKFDSMGTGKSRGGFVGVFHSKALPPIKTALTTQEDGSLGFVHTVPAAGYPLYGGKGRLAGGAKVKLNAQGLQSSGTMTYLGATLQSDRFVMYGDSLTGEGKTGTIAAGPNFPKVTMPPGYLINWEASSDSLRLQTPTGGAPVKMYADHTFKGSLLLTPKALGGDGRLDGPQSYVRSGDMTFKNDSYSGRKGLLSVKSAQAGKPALTANDVNFTYDLKNGYAEFKREEGSKASIDLPYTDFRTSLSGGRWDFKKKRVLLRATGADSARSYFASTRPEQNGLKFRAKAASYDLTKYQLQAKGVPYVAAADAWIIPDSGRVVVAGGGKMQAFHRAKVLLDSLGKFHKLSGGNITIASRDAFSGDAKYMSRSATGDSIALKFSNFQSDSASLLASSTGRKRFGLRRKPAAVATATPSLATTATANVEANQKFQLAPRIGFRGGINLNSQKRGLVFDGQVQLQFGKTVGPTTADWFAVKDSIDPKNIALNLRDLKSEDGTALTTGLYVSDADNKIYPLYAGPKTATTDVTLFEVDGTLRYDTKKGEYSIARQDLSDPSQYEGAVLTYSEATNQMAFRGPMGFITNSKNYGIAASGVGKANPDSARYQVQALLGIDMALPGKATEAMASSLAAVTKNSPEALNGSNEELYNIAQFAGNKGVEVYNNRRPGAAPTPLGTLSPKLLHTLTLSKVNLRWSPKQKAWYSEGKIGLAGVGKQGLNALVEGYVEIKRDNSMDLVEVYVEAEPQTWYYFRYANNVLLTKSSNEAFDGEVGGKQKGSIETALEYGVFLGEFEDVDRFRSHFQRDYQGKSGKLAARPAAPVSTGNFEFGADTNKKKKKGKANDAFADDPSAAPEPAPDTSKKKKKGKEDPFSESTSAPDPAAEPAAEPAKKKKKDKEAAVAEPAAEPTPEPAKKKKKAKSDDPFGDSEAAPVVAPAAKPAVAPAPAAPVKAPAATPPAAVPTAAPATPPAAKPVAPAPTPDPTANPTEEPAKKKKKEKAQEAEPDPNAEPGTEPPTETKKKKKKKNAEEDPFGDS
ncbi:hypothetical protein GO988_16270 [Hymenobacter sp. HMF4947]|uniref:Uncharacterized protein n=1 Tax=Hymenobacter ginkgonis TaxID=2682976 RepID=A0A7K1THH5_9BACT|nr:hypothetical protein [Hymenobacter ginkgonis]MVN77887.1 hypothetical protein [Hymenobacter ginkgonis]